MKFPSVFQAGVLVASLAACEQPVPIDPETRQTCVALGEQVRTELDRVYTHSRDTECSPKVGDAYYLLNTTKRKYESKCRDFPGSTRYLAEFAAVQSELTRRHCITTP